MFLKSLDKTQRDHVIQTAYMQAYVNCNITLVKQGDISLI